MEVRLPRRRFRPPGLPGFPGNLRKRHFLPYGVLEAKSMVLSTALQTDPPPIRKYVQWVNIGMQGGGVCIRKISGFVKVTSRSSPTKVRSQIFYVRTSEGHLLPNRAPQSLQCRGVPTGSALRAGALALAPISTGLRTGRRAPESKQLAAVIATAVATAMAGKSASPDSSTRPAKKNLFASGPGYCRSNTCRSRYLLE